LAFCKCANERWKKAAGKKSKFWVGESFTFYGLILIQFFIFWNFDFCNRADSIAYNGKSIGEVADKLDGKFNLART